MLMLSWQVEGCCARVDGCQSATSNSWFHNGHNTPATTSPTRVCYPVPARARPMALSLSLAPCTLPCRTAAPRARTTAAGACIPSVARARTAHARAAPLCAAASCFTTGGALSALAAPSRPRLRSSTRLITTAGVPNTTREVKEANAAGLAVWIVGNTVIAAALAACALGAVTPPLPVSLTPADAARGALMAGIILARSASQIVWSLLWRYYAFTPAFAAEICVYNLVFDAIALAGASVAGLAPLASDVVAQAGAALFVVGTLLERVPEMQRAAFKRDPANAGKPHMGGLWAVARHINYTGYTLWRIGAMLAARGWLPWSLLPVAGLALFGFPIDINAQKERNLAKYGKTGAYADYVARTPAMLPGVY